MSSYLLVDIGAGTMDVLWYEENSGLHYKAVVKSPAPCIAEKLAATPGDLLITGVEMGGGSLSQMLADRAGRGRVVMSASAAFTLHHDLSKVRSRGIEVLDDSAAEELRKSGSFSSVVVGDLDVERLAGIVKGFGIPFRFDIAAICAQDHGTPPAGVSHLDYRHNIFKARLDRTPFPHELLYKDDETPSTFNRLQSIAKSAAALPADEVYVMDSGMAAILGASMDLQATRKERLLVLDIATSHTVGASIDNGELAGFFEYHTHDVTLERLEGLLVDLADGKLEHRRILEEGGHGAYIRRAFGFEAVQAVIATGPKRRLLTGSSLPIVYGSPLGDNMMTGTVGLLEAVRRRKGLPPIQYL